MLHCVYLFSKCFVLCVQVTVDYFSLLHTVWSPVPVQVRQWIDSSVMCLCFKPFQLVCWYRAIYLKQKIERQRKKNTENHTPTPLYTCFGQKYFLSLIEFVYTLGVHITILELYCSVPVFASLIFIFKL